MEGPQNQQPKGRVAPFLTWVVNKGIEYVAALVLFLKTAEVFIKFAPTEILGMSSPGIHAAYGYVTALLVEGLLLATLDSLSKNSEELAWSFSILLIVLTFLVSAGAQLIDANLTRDTLDQLDPTVQWWIGVGVPLVPSLVLALAAGKRIFENIPDSMLEDVGKTTDRAGRIAEGAKARPGAARIYATEAEAAKVRIQLAQMKPDERAKAIAAMSKRALKELFGGPWKEIDELKAKARSGKL